MLGDRPPFSAENAPNPGFAVDGFHGWFGKGLNGSVSVVWRECSRAPHGAQGNPEKIDKLCQHNNLGWDPLSFAALQFSHPIAGIQEKDTRRRAWLADLDHTVRRDDARKPPTTANKQVVAVGMHERQEALAPKCHSRE